MPIWPGLAKVLIKTGVAQRIPSIQRVMGDGLPYLRYYNRRILASPNVELKATQSMLDGMGDHVIDLTSGAPTFGRPRPPLASAPPGYPPVAGFLELRTAVAEKLEAENGLGLDPEKQILVCNGVSQAIGLMLDTFVERKGRIAILDPSFFLYRLAAQNREMQVRRIPTWLEDGYVCFQEKDLRKALRGSAVLFVNSPCNPTGGILDEESLARIAYWCRRLDMLVFADEVYERFLYAGRHVSLASFADAAPRTITANSFSKSYGMAGARVGYVAGPQHLIQPMVVTLLSTAPFVSAAAQYEALRALTTSQNWFQVELDKLRTRRDWISSRLKRYGLDFSLPRGAFFFWIRVGGLGMDGASFSQLLLEEEQTLVMRGDTCGDSGREYVRISFAGSVDLIEEGINRLGNLLAKHFGVADAGVPSRIASHTQMQAA